MSEPLQFIFYGIICYFIGAIPFGYLIARSKGIDIRKTGSGNIGATNVGRALGKKWKVVVLLLDSSKGAGTVAFAQHYLYTQGPYSDIAPLLAGIITIIGHNWTIFLGFKGGKGVSTTAGVLAVLIPLAFCISAITYFAVTKMTRYVSVGSMVATTSVPISSFFFYRNDSHFLYIESFGILISGLVIFRHKSNIQRIFKGEEPKVGKP